MSAHGPSILILEDDQHWVDLYVRMLEDEYDVTVARTISTARELLAGRSFAAVLVDLKMPGLSGREMGGLDFIPEVKRLHPYTEVVVITAYGTLERAVEAGRGGVSAFIQKPVNMQELKDVTKRAVFAHQQNLRFQPPPDAEQPLDVLETILKCFPTSIQRVSCRGHGRPPFKIENEYDVQDLLYLMLKPLFPDLECEEHTPKTAGTASRVDFAIRNAGIVVEVKCVRNKSHARSVFDEVKTDIESYHSHAHCDTLVFFIYDPRFEIEDPQKKIHDLSGKRVISGREVAVRLLIRPC